MDTVTKSIIDKIKRLVDTGADTNEIILSHIESAFEHIYNDTGIALQFKDKVDYEIIPNIDGIGNASLRQAIVYKVVIFYLDKLKNNTVGRAIRVKSGRDEIDTTSSVGNYVNIIKSYDNEYKKFINKINIVNPREIKVIE